MVEQCMQLGPGARAHDYLSKNEEAKPAVRAHLTTADTGSPVIMVLLQYCSRDNAVQVRQCQLLS